MRNGKLYSFIRWLTPYGIVSSYVENNYRRRHNFIELFKQYVETGENCKLIEGSPYETIVSVQGFGYSGSGAIVDLLREYDTIHVIGYVDSEGSVTPHNLKCDEVDVLRLAGGLFEVERYIGSNNVFQNDALLHRVVAQFDSLDIYRNNPTVRPYCYEFMNQICEIWTDSPKFQDYNPYLNHHGANDILFLKELSIAEYRNLCRKLLNSIFTIIRQTTGNKQVLVLDQFTNDFEFDVGKYKEYIPNLKIVMVYRDPRDVYTFAKRANVEWIPHKSVDVFVKWYRMLLKHFNVDEQKAYMVVSFEELLDKYDVVVDEVEKYIGLNHASHTKKGLCLDITSSRKNISIWRTNNNSDNSCLIISQQLASLCYNDQNLV